MKNIFYLLVTLLVSVACSEKSSTSVTGLKCEYKVNPLGIDVQNPRFNWILESDQRGVSQLARQLLVSSSLKNLEENKGDIWDSQKIESNQTSQVNYAGQPLESDHKYFWKVLSWDQKGELHQSDPAYFTTGLLLESDWKAKWIGLDKATGEDKPLGIHSILSARMLRHEFSLAKRVISATAFVSGLGLFELYVNGAKIGDQVMAPALSQYNARAFYLTFDVAKYLQPNKNAVGVILGNGRFFSPRTGNDQTRTFGFPKVICQIEIKYEDGTTQTILSDESWKLATNGPIRKNNEYDGEWYDARLEMKDWSKAGFNDTSWMNAEIVSKPGEKLVAQPNECMKIMGQLAPIAMKESSPGKFIFDMGQNMVGWVELKVKGDKGTKVSLRFSETLKEDGTLFLDNIRSAEVTDTYILKGEGEESWEPRFTYHGFRFVEVTGFPGVPTLSAIKGKVIHDAMEETGVFDCSNPLINSIYKNAYWGIRGNYRSMPTDCPQRDERQGWLGDRSAECTGESYLFNISNLYNKWVTDMRDAQLSSGSLPDIAPAYWPTYSDNTTWPGTFIFASDMLYNQYGDIRTIETNYPAMQKWISHMSQFLNEGIMPKDTYGDWCVPPEDLKLINTGDPLRVTSGEYIGTAYFIFELKLMQKFAHVLGRDQDAAGYARTAEEMKLAFNKKFLNKTEVKYSNNTCTANILALAFDLVPSEFREKIVNNLLEKILGENAAHVGNGLIGGQWLMRTLTASGHGDVAYALAAQSTYPSWGYMVGKGATTIWELWNGDHGDPGMNSGNHVMLLGDLIIWFYESLAGIKADPEFPGFRHILMKPAITPELKFVTAAYKSVCGTIRSNWTVTPDKFEWKITIPSNCSATVYVPTLNREEVLEGGRNAATSEGVRFIRWEDNFALFEIKSGSYSFNSKGAKEVNTTPYVNSPVISPGDTILLSGSKLKVNISTPDGAAIVHYTTDGSMVNETSPVYSQPFEISNNTTVRVQAFRAGYHPSNQIKELYHYVDPARNGIQWQLYNGAFKKLPDFSRLKPDRKGEVYRFGLKIIDLPKFNFALQFTSFIQIDKDGKYTFYINSNDGSKLYIDGKLLVDNDGEHGVKEVSNTITLKKGRHLLGVEYFQTGGGKALTVSYSSEDISYQLIPESVLFKSNH